MRENVFRLVDSCDEDTGGDGAVERGGDNGLAMGTVQLDNSDLSHPGNGRSCIVFTCFLSSSLQQLRNTFLKQ